MTVTLGALAGSRGQVTDAMAREALRVTSEALGDDQLARLRDAAWWRVEHYCGCLYGSRSYAERWTVETAQRVRPGGLWRPAPNVAQWAKWTQAAGWQNVSAPAQVTPELYELAPGEWRATGTIGRTGAPADVIESVLRVMGYLYEVDPGSDRSHGDVVRRSGAASLLGPHCVRQAT